MVVKRCSDCGSELREEARFCDQCGFPVGQEEADLIFGRSEECSVRFSDPTVSRRHARAVCVGGVWYLRDEGSKNGTFVNGERLYPRAWRKLQLSDQIRLGAKVILRLTEKGWMEKGKFYGKHHNAPLLLLPSHRLHSKERNKSPINHDLT